MANGKLSEAVDFFEAALRRQQEIYQSHNPQNIQREDSVDEARTYNQLGNALAVRIDSSDELL